MPPETAEVRLLGGFAVTVDGRPAAGGWTRRRAAALVQMLALAPARRLARDQLVEALWPALPPERGAANLRKAAHHVRRITGEDGAVGMRGGVVELLPGARVTTDVERFERAAARALADGAPDACRAAAALYAGELLPDERYEAWCAERRESLRALHLEVLAGGRLWGRVLELEPADETAHREILRGHVEAGDRGAAIRRFQRMRTALREELGVSPGAESIALYRRVLEMEGDDDLPTPAERARALLAWGVVHWERADLDEAARAAEEARALAVDAGLGRELADAGELMGLVAYAQGRWREVFGRAFLAAVRARDEVAPFVFDANMCMSEFALEEEDGVRATSEFAGELMAAAEESGSGRLRALALLLRGEADLLGGRDARAAAALAEAARLHGESSSLTGRAIATSRLARAEALAGRVDAARGLHREALDLAERSPVPGHLLLFVYGGMLDPVVEPDAMGLVAEAEEAAPRHTCEPCSMPFLVGAARICAGAGDLGRARAHLAEAARISAMWGAGPWHAAVAEARAGLRAAEGADPAEAAALLREAARAYEASDRPREAARCRAAGAPS